MRTIGTTTLLLALLLAGCAFEGDDPGECDDGADNDRDGAFDCEDEGCAGAPVCAGDDDDAADDDDATDDDDAADDDDTGEAELIQPETPLVIITAPGFGYDLATDQALITVEGVAREDVEQVTWSVDTGASGDASGVQAWTAIDIPLAQGDNEITVTGTNPDGSGADTLRVVYAPGVPLASGLMLSTTAALAGQPVEVTASVWLSDDAGITSVEVGPSDSAGELTESWTVLDVTETVGLYAGTFTVNEASPTTWELRAVATFGADVGATPSVPFEVMEGLDQADFVELLQVAAAAEEVREAADPLIDPTGARDATLAWLLDQPGVVSAGSAENDGAGLWWIAEPGIGFVLLNNQPGEKGGGAAIRRQVPRIRWPASGPGSLRGWTTSSAGPSGRQSRQERNGGSITGNADLFAAEVFNDHFGTHDDGAWPANYLAGLSCAQIPDDLFVWRNDQADMDILATQFDSGLVMISSHGDTVFGGGAAPAQWSSQDPAAQVAVLSRHFATPQAMAEFELELLSGQLVVAGGPEGVFAWLPSWVAAQGAVQPMPNSMVEVSSCRSFWNQSLAAAYLSAGAAWFGGFTDYVDASWSQEMTMALWDEFSSRVPISEALASMDLTEPDDVFSPAYFVGQGDTSLILGINPLINGGFEDQEDGWDWQGDGIFDVRGQYWSIENTSAPEGSWMAALEVEAPESAWVTASRPFCPAPGQSLSLMFDWQVISENQPTCETAGVNWFVVRIDRAPADEDNVILWQQGWGDFCNDLYLQNEYSVNGWQIADVPITGPESQSWEDQVISIAVGGYDPQGFAGLIDNLHIGPP